MNSLHIQMRSLAAAANPHAAALREVNRRLEFMLPNEWAHLFLYSGKANELMRNRKERARPVLVGRFVVKPRKGEELEREMKWRARQGFENRFIVPSKFIGMPAMLEVRQGFDDGIPVLVPEQSRTFRYVTFFRAEEKFVRPMQAIEGKALPAGGLFLPDSRKISPSTEIPGISPGGGVAHLNGISNAYVGFATRRNSPHLLCGYRVDVCMYDALDLHANGAAPVSISFPLNELALAKEMASFLNARLQEKVKITSTRTGLSVSTAFGRVPQSTALLVLFSELAKTAPSLTLEALSSFLSGGTQSDEASGLSMQLVNQTLRRIYKLKWLWDGIKVEPVRNEQ